MAAAYSSYQARGDIANCFTSNFTSALGRWTKGCLASLGARTR
jgi:hypothetical protein